MGLMGTLIETIIGTRNSEHHNLLYGEPLTLFEWQGDTARGHGTPCHDRVVAYVSLLCDRSMNDMMIISTMGTMLELMYYDDNDWKWWWWVLMEEMSWEVLGGRAESRRRDDDNKNLISNLNRISLIMILLKFWWRIDKDMVGRVFNPPCPSWTDNRPAEVSSSYNMTASCFFFHISMHHMVFYYDIYISCWPLMVIEVAFSVVKDMWSGAKWWLVRYIDMVDVAWMDLILTYSCSPPSIYLYHLSIWKWTTISITSNTRRDLIWSLAPSFTPHLVPPYTKSVGHHAIMVPHI